MSFPGVTGIAGRETDVKKPTHCRFFYCSVTELVALVGEELSITDTIETVVTGSVRANNGVLSPVMEKRMINLLIIVLRAVVAVANALIAVLELIRELID